jgi:hypothetical protein
MTDSKKDSEASVATGAAASAATGAAASAPVIDPAADQTDRQAKAAAQTAVVLPPVKVTPVNNSEAVKEAQAKITADARNKEINICWNCANNGVEVELVKGICPDCGFDKSTIYNIALEPGRKI